MKAYVYGANGAEITDVAKPSPKGTQVLVKVHACGLERAELCRTKGHARGSAGGGCPGVGLMAMQIAKLTGAELVIGSSTGAMPRGRLQQFGADLEVDSSDPR